MSTQKAAKALLLWPHRVTIRQLSAVPTAPPSGTTLDTALPLRLSRRLRGTPSPGRAADSTRE